MENYFEILKLTSTAKPKEITTAIDDYEKNLRGNQSNLSKDDFQAGLKRVEAMRAWSADKAQVDAHRAAFTATQSAAVKAYFSSLPNHYEAYKKEVQGWIKRYRLSEEQITALMKADPNHLVEQAKAPTLPPNFLSSSAKDYFKHIEDLNNSAEITKIWPWAKTVKDFYAFLASILGKSVNEVRQMDSAVLFKTAEQNRDPMTNKAGGGFGETSKPLRNIFADLIGVFDPKKPENRIAYDNTILYESLRPLFDSLKSSPVEIRKDDKFAQNYIKQIKEKFEDEQIALAIYNKEASLLNDPYEPSKVVISMRCSNCGGITNFPTHFEAKKGKCAVCGSPFYIPCPNCNELVPASSQTCSHCNFNIMEFRKVGQYINSAKSALSRGDMSEAHLYLEQAIAADPKQIELKKIPDFAAISQKIQKGYEEYSKYFAGLTNLMASKSFMKAKQEAENVKKNFPNLDISAHLKKINEALDKVKNMMPAATDYSEAAALRCYEILDIVADYLPAKEHLHKVNLSPVENFRAVALQGAGFGTSLSWSPSKHSRVSYYLTRNDNHPPKTFSDGIILLKESSQNVFEDSKIEPGKAYYYAVFVFREGVFSPAANARFAYFADVDKLEGMPVGLAASISFSLPTNATGVRIYRKENAIPSGPSDIGAQLICPSTRLAFEDKSVQLDHQYGYLIQACYTENNQPTYSPGKGVLIRIERDPSDLNNVVIEKNGGAVVVSYTPADPSSPNPVRLYSINPTLVERRLHNLLTNDEVQAYIKGEKLLGSAKAKDGAFTFTIAGDYSYDVALISMTDAKARVCALGHVSSIPSIEVDKKHTQIKDAGKAYVRLKEVPHNCFGIHYIVLDLGHSKNDITQEDIQRRQTSFISGENYRREGLIDARGRAISSGAFKILLKGEFILNGNHVFSETTAAEISSSGPRTINYALAWEKKGLFKKTYSAKLTITCKGDLPTLVLMAKDTGAPVSANDLKAYKVLEISADSPLLTQAGDTYSASIPAEFIQPGMNFRLFLSQPNDETKVTPSDYGTLSTPK